MPSIFIYGTGWLAAILILSAIAGPSINYVLGGLGRPPVGALSRWHYRLGLIASAVATLHTLISITRSWFPTLAEVGLVMASAAFGLVAMQALIGSTMRSAQGQELRRARRYHLSIAPALVIAVGLHVALNGSLAAS